MDLLVNKARYVILIITDKWSVIMFLCKNIKPLIRLIESDSILVYWVTDQET